MALLKVFSIAVIYQCLCVIRVECLVTATQMRAHLAEVIPSDITGTSPQYYTFIRPVLDQTDVVNVQADLYLIGINSFDNSEQKLITTAYLDVQWKDEIIGRNWANSAVSGTVSEVYLPQDGVWLPDLALKNGFESLKGLGNSFLYVKTNSSGHVNWTPYHVFESGCEVDVTYFPFDKTICDLLFVIWSNPIDAVKVTKGSIGLNMDLYEKNSEWEILSTQTTDYETSTASGVTFSIVMKRKPLYYLLNILIPVIFLGILNVFVFVLPANAGEKTGYSVTAFLSFAIFLTIISTELPQNSENISVFSAYLFFMTVLSTIIVIVTLFQLLLFARGEDEPVTSGWEKMTRRIRKIRCVCCIGSGHVAIDEKKRLLHEQITCIGVSDAIDFVGFWVFLFLIVFFTTLTVLISALAQG